MGDDGAASRRSGLPSSLQRGQEVRQHAISSQVNTMYKTVAQKVQPVDDYPSDGSIPGGSTSWKGAVLAGIEMPARTKDRPIKNLQPRFTTMLLGQRLTDDR